MTARVLMAGGTLPVSHAKLGLLMAAVFLIGLLGAFGASYPVSIFVQDVLHLNQPEDSTLDEFATGFLSIVSCGLAFHLTIALCVPLLRVLGLLDAPTARFLAVRSAYFRVTFGLCGKHYRVAMADGDKKLLAHEAIEYLKHEADYLKMLCEKSLAQQRVSLLFIIMDVTCVFNLENNVYNKL